MNTKVWRQAGATAVVAGCFLSLGNSMAGAADYLWNNPLGGNFQDAANWLADGLPALVPPGSADQAIFNLNNATAYDVVLTDYTNTFTLQVQNDQVNLNLGGYTYDTTQDPYSTIIGVNSGDTASLNLTHGMLTANHLQVGMWDGSSGTLLLQGADAAITTINGFEVGNEGTGTATLTDSATLTAQWVKLGMFSNSTGTLNVQNGASLYAVQNEFILVGERSQGTLNITNGGHVQATWILAATTNEGGSTPNLRGDIFVDGAGSDLTVDHQIILGSQGLATMTMSNQATASTGGFGGMVVGELAGSYGQLLIQSGAVLTSYEDSRIAVDPFSKGRAIVTGAGSKWDIGGSTLMIGQGGDAGSTADDAGLTIADGAEGYAGQLHLGGIAVTQTPNDPPIDPPPAWVLHQSHGALTVTGINSSTSQASLFQVNSVTLVGLGGNGYLFVQQGGRFETADLKVGLQVPWTDELGVEHLSMGQGSITVEDPGSTLRVTAGEFYLGTQAQTQTNVLVRNGGNITSVDHVVGWYDSEGNPVDPSDPGAIAATSSAWVFLGLEANSSATVTVTDPGSTFNVDHAPLIVAQQGQAILNVLNGGVVNCPHGELWIAMEEGSIGQIHVQGVDSQLIETSEYNSLLGRAGTGRLTISDQGLVKLSNLIIGEQPTGDGLLTISDGAVLQMDHSILVGPNGQGQIHLQNGTIQLNDGELLTLDYRGQLTGSGQILGGKVVNYAGVIAPGNSPGLLQMDSLDQIFEGTLKIELAGLTRGLQYDGLNVTFDVTLQGHLVLQFTDGFAPLTGDTFDLILAQNVYLDPNLDVQVLGLLTGWQYSLVSDAGLLQLVSLSDGVVPEPASLLLLTTGGLLLALRRRTR